MVQRYRITREHQDIGEPEKTITLDECRALFAQLPDFDYASVYTVKGSGGATTMSIDGDFFLWRHDGAQIPFRHYRGDLYVSGAHEAVVPKMIEVASALRADIEEG
ncbi:hypothetical protein [Paenibacillus sp.]|uniref:hypothetical protein n=1 Tax=Paenibacillus sp. TaxID=58172 RepID=UPI002D406593|nr:hypothetical protein [Paenibacillus sp.]HZG58730.1 hypothetical protein [Paenibacillus sp.]